MNQKLTLETLCGGAVQEKVDRALHAIAENILDPNTDAKKKRSITLKIIFAPNGDDREDVTVSAEVTKSLAPETGVKTQLFMTKDIDDGSLTIQEHARGEIKGQLNFSDIMDEMGQDDGSEFDPETGEIITQEASGGVIDFQRKKTSIAGAAKAEKAEKRRNGK